MRCMHAISILVDGRREFVPCGKCNFCLEARRADWSFRLRQELKVSTSAFFITYTYEETPKTEAGVETLCKKDMQDFYKRLRQENLQKIRHYTVGEYGTKGGRPHYHSATFNLDRGMEASVLRIWHAGYQAPGTKRGHVLVVPLNDACIHYVTKYHVNKIGEYSDRAPPFALMSRKPGLGLNYLETHSQWHREGMRGFTRVGGIYGRLPRFYADKLFTKEEKEQLSKEGLSELGEYRAEILRLSKLHHDPYSHYVERRRAEHDAVKHKGNKNDKF